MISYVIPAGDEEHSRRWQYTVATCSGNNRWQHTHSAGAIYYVAVDIEAAVIEWQSLSTHTASHPQPGMCTHLCVRYMYLTPPSASICRARTGLNLQPGSKVMPRGEAQTCHAPDTRRAPLCIAEAMCPWPMCPCDCHPRVTRSPDSHSHDIQSCNVQLEDKGWSQPQPYEPLP